MPRSKPCPKADPVARVRDGYHNLTPTQQQAFLDSLGLVPGDFAGQALKEQPLHVAWEAVCAWVIALPEEHRGSFCIDLHFRRKSPLMEYITRHVEFLLLEGKPETLKY